MFLLSFNFVYEKSLVEKIGGFLTYPIFRPTDSIFKNINIPHVVTALTVGAIAVATFVFYTTESSELLVKLIPSAGNIKAMDKKLTGYCFTQSIILGIGLRALARLCNETLMYAWDNQTTVPILVGTVIFSKITTS